MSNIDKSNKSSDLEGTPSSGIPRFHKGDDELALEYRKTLQRFFEAFENVEFFPITVARHYPAMHSLSLL